jgi:DEK C terminal domain
LRSTAISHHSHASHRSRGHPSEYGAFAGIGIPSVMDIEQNYRQNSYSNLKADPRASQALTLDGTMMGGNFSQEMYQDQQGFGNNASYGCPVSGAYSGYNVGSQGAHSVIMDGDASHQNNMYPNDDQILGEIRRILSTADLMTMTKKQVRDELSVFFGIDMTFKDYINRCIEVILQGKL